MTSKRPVIGIPADRRMLGHHPYHLAGEKYLTAVLDGAGGLPLIVPAIGRELEARASCSRRSTALLFTGSPSNVEPHHYRGAPSDPRHAARSAPGRDDAAADSARDRGRRAGARHLPRVPGDERRLRRHAVAEAAGGAGLHRPPRGQDAAARGAVRAGARGDTGARRTAAQRWRARDRVARQFAALRRACSTLGAGSRSRGARAGRRHRGVPRQRRAALRARGAVASGVAGHEESIFAGAVRAFGAGRARSHATAMHEGDL